VARAEDTIRSDRLDLVLFGPNLMDALIAGDRVRARALARFALPEAFPGDGTIVEAHEVPPIRLIELRRAQLAAHPSWRPWLLRALVRRDDRLMVGYANFHGPPGVNDTEAPGAAEIGYSVFAEHRGRGYATEAARAMMAWAHAAHGVRHFISGVAPDNAPSLRVIEKLGFAPTGQVVDGELIFETRVG